MCVQGGLKRGIIELESAIAISLYRAAALCESRARFRGDIFLSFPSILTRSPPPSRSLNPGRDRRAERGDGFAHGRTWSMFRVFREINPLVLSTYTRRRRSAATPVNAYTHGISIIWIVKVFGRQLQPPNLCSPPSWRSSRLPGTITRLSLKADFTLGKYRCNATHTRLANLNLNVASRIKLFYSEVVLSQAACQKLITRHGLETRSLLPAGINAR